LLAASIRVIAVVTRPDKRRGRGNATEPSPVKKVALDNALPVFETPGEIVAWLETRGVDGVTGVVVAYGRIIKDPLLSLVPLVNLHFSLLPRWRGAAPVERAILAGDTETGATIMQIEEGLDTGGVYAIEPTRIDDNEDVVTLRSRLGVLGARALVKLLKDGFPAPLPQEGLPVHADKLGVDELRIDWMQSASRIQRVIRLGGAFSSFRGQRLKIHRADVESGTGPCGSIIEAGKAGVVVACGEGALRLVDVQPEGKKVMSSRDWSNGVKPVVGDMFGADYGAST
jgi:methionyl-tRNA formyltransferase